MTKSRSAFAALALLSTAAAAATALEPLLLFAAIGLWALVIVCVPLLTSRRFDLFSPWHLVVVTVLLTLTLRGIAMTLGVPSREQIESYFLRGEGVGFFVWPSIVILLGLIALAAGYLLVRRPRPLAFNPHWSEKRLGVVVALCALLSLAATGLYVQRTGGFEPGAKLSAKRVLIPRTDLENAPDYRSHFSLKTAARLSEFAYYLLLAHFLAAGKALRNCQRLALGAMFALAVILPIYTSSRLEVGWMFLLTLAIWHYSPRRLAWRGAAALLLTGALLIHGIGELRKGPAALAKGAQTLAQAEPPLGWGQVPLRTLWRGFWERSPLAQIVLRMNGPGLAKSAHVMHAIPETLELEYGRTIAVWLVAPIPREVWPGKPRISAGPLLGERVFGTFGGHRRTGIPPGLFAELYWNFHWPGVVLGCFLLGLLLRWLYLWLQPGPTNKSATLVYVLGPMALGFQALWIGPGFALALTSLGAAAAVGLIAVVSWRNA